MSKWVSPSGAPIIFVLNAHNPHVALRALLHLPLRLTSVLPFPSSLAHCTQLGGTELAKVPPILPPLPLHFPSSQALSPGPCRAVSLHSSCASVSPLRIAFPGCFISS